MWWILEMDLEDRDWKISVPVPGETIRNRSTTGHKLRQLPPTVAVHRSGVVRPIVGPRSDDWPVRERERPVNRDDLHFLFYGGWHQGCPHHRRLSRIAHVRWNRLRSRHSGRRPRRRVVQRVDRRPAGWSNRILRVRDELLESWIRSGNCSVSKFQDWSDREAYLVGIADRWHDDFPLSIRREPGSSSTSAHRKVSIFTIDLVRVFVTLFYLSRYQESESFATRAHSERPDHLGSRHHDVVLRPGPVRCLQKLRSSHVR